MLTRCLQSSTRRDDSGMAPDSGKAPDSGMAPDGVHYQRYSDAALTALLSDQGMSIKSGVEKHALVPEQLSFVKVREDIAKSLHDSAHDDGSYTPLLIRFAWHSSGTYDEETNTGGSDGGTIWREVEAADPENAGLDKARAWLRRLHARHCWMTMADLAILAAYVAIEASGGPHIPFAYGRQDFTDEQAVRRHGPSGCPFGDGKYNPNGSRLPSADLGPAQCPHGASPAQREKPTIDAIRGTFSRLGFDDKATVNLIILGHQYGRCHPEVSGYEHPWYVFGPSEWNVYGPGGLGYISIYGMLQNFAERISSGGKRQFNFQMGRGEPFMMLVSDMALWWDSHFRKHVRAPSHTYMHVRMAYVHGALVGQPPPQARAVPSAHGACTTPLCACMPHTNWSVHGVWRRCSSTRATHIHMHYIYMVCGAGGVPREGQHAYVCIYMYM